MELCTHHIITAHFFHLLEWKKYMLYTPSPSQEYDHVVRVLGDDFTSGSTNSSALSPYIASVRTYFLFITKQDSILPLHCYRYKNQGSGKLRASLSLKTKIRAFALGLCIHCLAVSLFLILQMSCSSCWLRLIRRFSYKLHPGKGSFYCGKMFSTQPSMGHIFQIEKDWEILRPLSAGMSLTWEPGWKD